MIGRQSALLCSVSQGKHFRIRRCHGRLYLSRVKLADGGGGLMAVPTHSIRVHAPLGEQ